MPPTEEKLTIGVKRFDQTSSSDSLIKTLRATRLFRQVDYLDRLSSPPDLIATIEQQGNSSTACPVPTILSFGIIPSHTTDTFGHIFSLQSPGNESRKIVIDQRYEATTTIGWIALLRALSPEETLVHPERHVRYRANLRLVLQDRSPELEALSSSQKTASVTR